MSRAASRHSSDSRVSPFVKDIFSMEPVPSTSAAASARENEVNVRELIGQGMRTVEQVGQCSPRSVEHVPLRPRARSPSRHVEKSRSRSPMRRSRRSRSRSRSSRRRSHSRAWRRSSRSRRRSRSRSRSPRHSRSYSRYYRRSRHRHRSTSTSSSSAVSASHLQQPEVSLATNAVMAMNQGTHLGKSVSAQGPFFHIPIEISVEIRKAMSNGMDSKEAKDLRERFKIAFEHPEFNLNPPALDEWMSRRVKALPNHKAVETQEKLLVSAQFKIMDIASPLLDLLSQLRARPNDPGVETMISSAKAAVIHWARAYHHITQKRRYNMRNGP